MNAIPLINNAPRPNINVGSIGSPTFNPVAAGAKLGGSIGGNVMRQNPVSMPVNNETQLRQEVNTSIVALKREAFSLENLIAQAAQTLQDINKRLSELEGKQGDYVKKADATVESVGGNGKYISAISETDGKINATATDLGNMVPVNSVTSGNMHSVTSGAVYDAVYSSTPIVLDKGSVVYQENEIRKVGNSYIISLSARGSSFFTDGDLAHYDSNFMPGNKIVACSVYDNTKWSTGVLYFHGGYVSVLVPHITTVIIIACSGAVV